jgi:hypothetical protein
VRSSVPTVFASGDTDGGTPLWFMEHAGEGFSHRLEVVLRGQGHTEWNDCIAQIYQQLVVSGSVDGGGPSTCSLVPRPPFQITVGVLLIVRKFTGVFCYCDSLQQQQATGR